MDTGLRRHDGVAPVGEAIFPPIGIRRIEAAIRALLGGGRALPAEFPENDA